MIYQLTLAHAAMGGAGQTPRASHQALHSPVPRQRQLKMALASSLCFVPTNSPLSQVGDEDLEVHRS